MGLALQFFLEMWQDIKELSLQHLDSEFRDGIQKLRQHDPTGLFDSFTKSFDSLAARSDELLVRHVQREVVGELKPYINR